jgi:hypothetical protein
VLPYRKIRIFYTDPNTGVRTYRFTGYVEEWPVEWPNGGAYSQATITATDRMARLGARLPLQSVIEQVMFSQSPSVYFRLGEESGSTSAADSIGLYANPMTILQYGSGGTLDFGTATGPPTDGLPAPTFTRADAANGKCLYASFSKGLRCNGAISIRCSFLSSTVDNQVLVQLDSEFVAGEVGLYISAAGKLTASAKAFTYIPPGSTLNPIQLGSPTSVADGLTHDAELVLDGSNAYLYLDGVLVDSDTYNDRVARDALVGIRIGGIAPGGVGSKQLLNGVISHIAVFPYTQTAAQPAEQYQATSTGFSGDSSDQRISRLAKWSGLVDADMSLDSGSSRSICFVDTTGVSALTAMQDVAEKTEGGRLFIGRDGLLTFKSRDTVTSNPATRVTIDANLLGPESRFVMSTQGLLNDLSGKRPTGADIRVFDQGSIDAYGYFRDTPEYLLTSDVELVDALNWKVAGHSQPTVQMPQAAVDLYTDTTGIAPQLRAMDIGDRITVTGLPSQAPTPTVDLIVEGYTENVGLGVWNFAANLSNYQAVRALILDDAVYGLLGGDNRLTY